MSNDECRKNDECLMTNAFPSGFVIGHSFDIRHSTLERRQVALSVEREGARYALNGEGGGAVGFLKAWLRNLQFFEVQRISNAQDSGFFRRPCADDAQG